MQQIIELNAMGGGRKRMRVGQGHGECKGEGAWGHMQTTNK